MPSCPTLARGFQLCPYKVCAAERVGYAGRGSLPPMFENLLTEQPNPASAHIDALPTEEMLRIINAEDRKVAEALERVIPSIARAVEAIAAALGRGGRLFYI